MADFDKYFKVQRSEDPEKFLSKITLFKNVFKKAEQQQQNQSQNQKTRQQIWTNNFKQQKDDQRIQMQKNKVSNMKNSVVFIYFCVINLNIFNDRFENVIIFFNFQS